MILHLSEFFNSLRIVLASGSPRRKEILSNMGLKFEVVVSQFAEDLDKSTFPTPAAYVLENATIKARAVFDGMQQDSMRPNLVIGADTVVVADGRILEKPSTKEHAREMLASLSGRSHSVFTGVSIISLRRDATADAELVESFVEETQVTFADLSEELIAAYVETGEPMDKAGSYGIQGIAGTLVTGIRGDYLNVVGFPANAFSTRLRKMKEDGKL